MLSRRADVRQVEYRLERELVLRAEIVGVGRRNLAFVVEGGQRGRRNQLVSRADILQAPEEESLLDDRRRILYEAEDCIALRTVVEDAAAAANYERLVASEVISESEARREVDAAIAVDSALDPLARLQHSVSQLASVRHDPSNEGRRDNIPRRRVHPYTGAGRVLARPVEQRRVRRIVAVGQE